jgi:Spy/CpxP family protein refolding chaperone
MSPPLRVGRGEEVMRHLLSLTIAMCLVLLSAIPLAQQAQPTTVSTTTPVTTIDEVLREIRADLQGERADIMSKNMTLTSEQAAKFWPVFADYQKEQNVIMDDQMRAMQTFLEKLDTLSDADALALIKGHFDRDARMVALRQQWLPKFQEVLGAKLAVRAMQIDRRLSLVQQIQFTSRLPLAH